MVKALLNLEYKAICGRKKAEISSRNPFHDLFTKFLILLYVFIPLLGYSICRKSYQMSSIFGTFIKFYVFQLISIFYFFTNYFLCKFLSHSQSLGHFLLEHARKSFYYLVYQHFWLVYFHNIKEVDSDY
jgi:hypothetical protein